MNRTNNLSGKSGKLVAWGHEPASCPGHPRRDDRAIFDRLIWLARTGAQWSQLPREFGPKSTVHVRFSEWIETGRLERAWAALSEL